MAIIKAEARPNGQSKTYQFFRNVDTGALWKASAELRPARGADIETDVATAPAENAVTVVVSPVDEMGKALRQDDKPIIIDSHTHTFTTVQMADASFDPMAYIVGIIGELIDAGEKQLSGNDKIKNFMQAWVSEPKLKGNANEAARNNAR